VSLCQFPKIFRPLCIERQRNIRHHARGVNINFRICNGVPLHDRFILNKHGLFIIALGHLKFIAFDRLSRNSFLKFRCIFMHQTEFKVRHALNDLNGFVTVSHAGKLKKDLLFTLALKHSFTHTQAIDTVTEDLHGACHSI